MERLSPFRPAGGGPAAIPSDPESVLWALLEGRYFVVDARGRITRWSAGAAARLGWSQAEVQRRSAFSQPLAWSDGGERWMDFLEHGGPRPGPLAELTLLCRDGSELPAEFTVVPVALRLGHEFTALVGDLVGRGPGSQGLEQLVAAHPASTEAIVAALGDDAEWPERLAGVLVGFRATGDPTPCADERARDAARALRIEPDDEGQPDEDQKLDAGLERLAARLEQLTAERDAAREERDELSAARDAAREERDELSAALDTASEERDELRAAFDAAAAERDEAQAALETAVAEREEAKAALAEPAREREEERAMLARLQTEGEAARVALAELAAENAELKRRLDEAVAGRDLAAARIAEAEQALASERDRIAEAEQALASERDRIAEVRDRVAALEEQRDGVTIHALPPLPRARQVLTDAGDPRPGLDDVPTPRARIGLDGRFSGLNAAFCKLVGYPEAEFRRALWPPLSDPESDKALRELTRQLIDGELESGEIDAAYMHSEGLLVPIVGTLFAERDEGGSTRHLVLDVEPATA